MKLNTLLDIPSTDPDYARKGKLLNIILVGVAGLLIIVLIFSIFAIPYAESMAESWVIFGGGFILLIGMVFVYFINKYRSGKVAAATFLVLLTTVVTFSDTSENLASGRSLFIFTIPIIMASVLLTPASSFIFSALSSAIISMIALSIGGVPNIPAIGGYFVVALISWLSSRSLEQALTDLRKINAELDRRVEERTHELSAALARELAEAGKSQAILEGIADGVAVFDPNGLSIVANPSLSYLLDIPVGNLKGVTMEAVLQAGNVSPQERGTILAMLGNPSMNNPSVRVKWGKRTLLVNAAQVMSGLGNLIGTVAVFRDFTHEADIEQMKGTFVAMVSHELRTPLNAIIGYAEMMRESVYGPVSPRQIGIMERIENSGKRLLSLVSDLLDQAQIDAGRMKINVSEFRLSDAIETVHAQMDKQIADKGLYFTTTIDPTLPVTIVGDSRRLQQVFINLIGNAAKFTVTGGIKLNAYRVDEKHWGFEVVDTGPGIPPEAREYVFESFRQVEGVTTREHGGVGLGLAIVKSLVGLMGGKISLESEVGRGTTFSVTIPFAPPKEKK